MRLPPVTLKCLPGSLQPKKTVRRSLFHTTICIPLTGVAWVQGFWIVIKERNQLRFSCLSFLLLLLFVCFHAIIYLVIWKHVQWHYADTVKLTNPKLSAFWMVLNFRLLCDPSAICLFQVYSSSPLTWPASLYPLYCSISEFYCHRYEGNKLLASL